MIDCYKLFGKEHVRSEHVGHDDHRNLKQISKTKELHEDDHDDDNEGDHENDHEVEEDHINHAIHNHDEEDTEHVGVDMNDGFIGSKSFNPYRAHIRDHKEFVCPNGTSFPA